MIDAETELMHLCAELLDTDEVPNSLLEEIRHYCDVALMERDLNE